MSDFQKLKQLFDELAQLSPAERSGRLHRGEVDDVTRDRLRALFEADELLEAPTARRAVGEAVGHASPWIGRRVGVYVLEGELGRGGMGSVFLGHRADGSVEQKVAVKLIRTEQVDEHTLRRFRLERQVLALLKHPNIATLLDLGELDDGTPYIVMEYIQGEPIINYAKSLSLKQRLGLFLHICDAVAYAHRNMVVHRDLKSSNILVTAEGQPKLLDFGIAKPLLQRFGAHEIRETGAAQRFFSLHNAAPEQVRGDPITVGCDVYGLGMLLYELLARMPPFDFSGKTVDEIQRLVQEATPPAPSARADEATACALRGDLDAIVLRALRKSPEDRYLTVEQFANDISCYLGGRPVEARRGRTWYRLRKFAGRNRVSLSVVILFLTLLGSATIVLWMQALEVVRQRDRAVQATNFLVETFATVDPKKTLGEMLTARQILNQAESTLVTDRAMEPGLRVELIGRIAEIRLHLQNWKDALPLTRMALRQLDNASSADLDTRTWLLELQVRAATSAGDFDLARRCLTEAVDKNPYWPRRWLLEQDATELLYLMGSIDELHPYVNEALYDLSRPSENARASPTERENSYRDGLHLAEKVYTEGNKNLAAVRAAYGLFLNKRHNFAAAEKFFGLVVAQAARWPGRIDENLLRVAKVGAAIAAYGKNPTPQARKEIDTLTMPSDATQDVRQIVQEQREVLASLLTD